MRWFWIDRFNILECDKAQAVKNVTLAEEHLHDHFPGFPLMPRCLMIEGMAQTAGVMAGMQDNFTENVILAKIQKASFYELVIPGDRIIYDAKLIETHPEGHRAEIRATVEGKLVAEAEMMFVNYRDPETPADQTGLSTTGDGSKKTQENFVFAENFAVLLGMNRPAKTADRTKNTQ